MKQIAEGVWQAPEGVVHFTSEEVVFLEREAQEYEDAAEPGDDIFLKIAKDYRRTAKQLRLLEEEIQRKNPLRPASNSTKEPK